jgi:flagellar basal body P-ring protein FlgI
MISAGVGESLEDYNNRQAKAIGYVRSEDKKSALIELTNQQQCVFNALQEYSPSNMAFAVMVHSIDGQVFEKYDENTLEEIINKLEDIGLTKADLMEALREVKKK